MMRQRPRKRGIALNINGAFRLLSDHSSEVFLLWKSFTDEGVCATFRRNAKKLLTNTILLCAAFGFAAPQSTAQPYGVDVRAANSTLLIDELPNPPAGR